MLRVSAKLIGVAPWWVQTSWRPESRLQNRGAMTLQKNCLDETQLPVFQLLVNELIYSNYYVIQLLATKLEAKEPAHTSAALPKRGTMTLQKIWIGWSDYFF